MGIQTVNPVSGQYQISKGFQKSKLISLVSNKKTKYLQFASPLSTKEIKHLEKHVFSNRPDISLRVYGHYGEICDLSFLELIPSLRRISIDCLIDAKNIEVITKFRDLEHLSVGIYNLDNFDFLEKINPELKELSLQRTKSKKPKISSISRFTELESLYLEGQQKGIESISHLKNLEQIILRSISTDNLDCLSHLENLWSVDIKLGGIKNFDSLTTLSNLKYLELWQIRDLSDLSFISRLTSLQNLFIQSLKQLIILPDFKNCTSLRRIYLENLKSLKDLGSLKNAPSLEEFAYSLAQNQEPKNLLPILENDNLKYVRCLFGSDKKNNEFIKLANAYGKSKYELSEFKYKS